MFEMLVNPAKAEREPWEMFLVGLFYASLAVLLVHWIFSSDPVLSKYSGMIVVTFTVMLSLPFMYYLFKIEEEKDVNLEGIESVAREHEPALKAFLWLFLGFIVAFSFWHILLADQLLFKAQTQTYCAINSPANIDNCVLHYDSLIKSNVATGATTQAIRFISISENNIYVLIFTLIFSLIFGAGAIFILAWNASVIAAAIGIFSEYQLKNIPLGVLRYMIHGLPEIAAYFVGALAGGILSIGLIKYGIKDKRLFRIATHSLILIGIALVILVLAGLVEVYITPAFFN